MLCPEGFFVAYLIWKDMSWKKVLSCDIEEEAGKDLQFAFQ